MHRPYWIQLSHHWRKLYQWLLREHDLYGVNVTSTGMAMITVYFKQVRTLIWQLSVQNRVSQAQALLPANAAILGVTVSKASEAQMWWVFSYDRWWTIWWWFLTNYNNINIVPMFKALSMVSVSITRHLVWTYSMRVGSSRNKMKQHKLVPSDVSIAVEYWGCARFIWWRTEQSSLVYHTL